ncbi:hypothetical protein Sste5344_005860 [Sporothrix stenoceras]
MMTLRMLQSYGTPHSVAATDIITSEEGSSYVVSPAIADDDRVFQEYLCNTSLGHSRRMVRFELNFNGHGSANGSQNDAHTRPILFGMVPRRGERETESRKLAASHLETTEKMIAPHEGDVIDLFFKKINLVFPIFDETQFRRVLTADKERISPSLLATLYGIAMTFWNYSPQLATVTRPDVRSVLVQAEDSFIAELISTPGISTIITFILNISGRPSSHHLGNGAFLGLAVALANAFGLNRDPTDWNLSPSEKKFRIRIWWLLVVYDRWCSLAYGTPPLIRSTAQDVPILTVEDISNPNSHSDQTFAASCFVALVTLTEVLYRCLEHVYNLDKYNVARPESSLFDFETLLTNWEDSLSDDLRRLVIRGTNLVGPGAANLRLAYLSVKLFIRRIQLDWDKVALRVGGDADSQYFIQARRAAEEIVDFVRELDATHFADFWMPPSAYSLTSATTFLLRSALNARRGQPAARNSPLKLARAMVDSLRAHRRDYDWDIADNCLFNCSDLVDKIEEACDQQANLDGSSSGSNNTVFDDLQNHMPVDIDMDFAALNGLFPGFTGSL